MKRGIIILLVMLLAANMGMAFAHGEPFAVAAPQGAPAVTVAVLASETPEDEAVFDFVAANTITAKFEEATSDMIIAPLNAGAMLYHKGNRNYQLAAVVTWGNLVFASQRENFTLQDMNGQPVVLFGEKTVNASIAQYILESSGIVPSEISFLASAAETQQLLLSDPDAIVMTAEPMCTAAKLKNEKIVSWPLNELYAAVTGYQGFAQAGLFVRRASLEEKPEEIGRFLELIRISAETCTTDTEKAAAAAVALEILPNEKIALLAIPNCSIRFVGAAEAKEEIEKTAAIDLALYGGELPPDDFYYAGE